MAKAWQVPPKPVVDPMSAFDRELFEVGRGIGNWLAGRPDTAERRAAEMRCLEMRRFASEGRGDVWRRELREETRLVLVAAGYFPVRRDDDVLVGAVLVEGAEEVFKVAKKEFKTR